MLNKITKYMWLHHVMQALPILIMIFYREINIFSSPITFDIGYWTRFSYLFRAQMELFTKIYFIYICFLHFMSIKIRTIKWSNDVIRWSVENGITTFSFHLILLVYLLFLNERRKSLKEMNWIVISIKMEITQHLLFSNLTFKYPSTHIQI